MEKKKVLIIDDDTEFDEKLSEKIRFFGMEPIVTVTGQEALDYVSANKVDFIVLDFVMPDMDGLEFYHALKHDMRKNIPTVILTNLSNVENTEGLEVYTKTAINLDDFVGKIFAALNK